MSSDSRSKFSAWNEVCEKFDRDVRICLESKVTEQDEDASAVLQDRLKEQSDKLSSIVTLPATRTLCPESDIQSSMNARARHVPYRDVDVGHEYVMHICSTNEAPPLDDDNNNERGDDEFRE